MELLTETARSSQELVDQVVARDGDPTVAALLLGKAAQAKERGVEWSADMQPAHRAASLGPVDAVSLVGNLIDNAHRCGRGRVRAPLDAGRHGARPPAVRSC